MRGKTLTVLLIFIVALSFNFAFAEDNATAGDIYVSNEGSDSLGNGTWDNPYQTLGHTIEIAQNNSNICLKSGTYNSTGYVIENKSVSISGIGEVVIDGQNGKLSQNIFTVKNGSILVLNNLRFVNGYADFESDIHTTILNQGQLYINDCSFKYFSTIDGVIKNENYLHMTNVEDYNLEINWDLIYGSGTHGYNVWVAEELVHPPRGELITNVGNCTIENSSILSTVYNARNMTLDNCYLTTFISNRKYINQSTFTYFNNSNIHKMKIANCTSAIFNGTYINCDFGQTEIEHHKIISSNLYFENSTFSESLNEKESLDFTGSNVTAKSCVFNQDIHIGKGNVDISYSTILGRAILGYDGVYTLNYNWWGDNKGPKLGNMNEFSKVYAHVWIVMVITDSGNSQFCVDLGKCTNGNSIFNLDEPSRFNPRFVKMETESGEFTNKSGYLVNAKFNTRLLNNNPDTVIYATVDGQVLRKVIGKGLTDYKIYVSDSEGNDYYNDGSYESPYKTLKQAISVAFSGNTIYMKSGTYSQSRNSNLKISKNLTIVGIGNVTLERPNNKNIFIVDSKGLLYLENLNFTLETHDIYYNPLIELSSGSLNVKDCNFYNMAVDAVIMVKNSDYVNLDNVSFNKIKGRAILGFANNLYVKNSRFSNGSLLDSEFIYQRYNPEITYSSSHLTFYITISSAIHIVNTTFSDNTIGAVGNYHVSINRDFWNVDIDWYTKLKTYIYNSTFKNNRWDKDPVKDLEMGLAIGNDSYSEIGYGFIDNCDFINNTGHLMYANVINNSRFINNSGIPYLLRTDVDLQNKGPYYYPSCLIRAYVINNSYFYGNSFMSLKYEEMVISANEVYSSVFIENRAAYGGALSNCREVHYCVFVNNSATYGGDDIFLYAGRLNCSGNWWGSNQKPDSSRVYVFLGELIIDNWVVMSIESESDMIRVSLDNLLDNERNICRLNHTLPSRFVEFSTEGGTLTPQSAFLSDNVAYTKLVKNTTKDFDVFARIDNQQISLTVYNNSTLILAQNMSYYGSNNRFDITLLNINGHKISKQLLNVIVRNSTGIWETFTLTTDDSGQAFLDVSYPVGKYAVDIDYYGNGYFEKSHAQASIEVSPISTRLVSYNYTYHGKNNRFYAMLTDKYGKYISNMTLILKIYNSNGRLISTNEAKTSTNGRAEVLLSLEPGNYKLVWDFIGNDWYGKSHSESYIDVEPINTTIELPSGTLYGKGNDYMITFRDAYGTLISGETITVTISNGTDSSQFSLKTEKGIASININLLPGSYHLEAAFAGDSIYGASKAKTALNIEPVFVTLDYASRISIPLNGIFTVILKDMYGKKVSGENVSLELTYKTFDKKYTAISDANGEANFRIDADENSYFGLIEYGGSTWYRSTSGASTITVSHDVVLNNVYLNGSDFTAYYGENKYYTILFNDSNAYSLEGKTVSVIISSGEWSKSFDVESDILGNVRLQITLDPGKYNISYKYQNAYYNLHASGRNTINIFKMPTNLIVSDLIVKKDDSKSFEVKLTNRNGAAIANLPVTVSIDGNEINATTNSLGIAKVLLDLDLGYHNVACSFDNVNYIQSFCNATILVVDDTKTVTHIESDKTYSREGDAFNYSAVLLDSLDNPLKSSEMALSIFDLEDNPIYNAIGYTNDNGSAVFNLNLPYGSYLAKTYYRGNDLYFESFNTNSIYISPLENVTETVIFADDMEIVNGYDDRFSVVLKTSNGDGVFNATVEFTINNQTYFAITDETGKAYLDALFKPGAYEIKTRFAGSNNLTKALAINHIHILGELLYMFSDDIVKSFNNGSHYYVGLFDARGQPLTGKLIRFQLEDQVFENVTDSEGIAMMELWLNPGKYRINATYQGFYRDEYASVSNNITVLTTLISENVDKCYDKNTALSATLFDFSSKPLANAQVIFNINGINYGAITDENGVAILNIDLAVGKYIITIYNTLTYQFEVFDVNIRSSLETADVVNYYKGTPKFSATFRDANGDLLKNANVKFIVNGREYNAVTDLNGVGVLKNNLKPGTYTITTLNTATGEMHVNTLTVKTIIISKNKKVKAKKKINFKVKILKSTGKVAKKVKVKFKINKKIYNARTNSKGIAKLNIKLKKGKYTITTTYNGLSVKNIVRVVK